MGGSVKGGKVLGRHPETLELGSELDLGRGRFLPTTSWEALWHPVLQWFGVEEEGMSKALPNLQNFPVEQRISREELFS
jgi:uncharacterized protein (DUF1501 family)